MQPRTIAVYLLMLAACAEHEPHLLAELEESPPGDESMPDPTLLASEDEIGTSNHPTVDIESDGPLIAAVDETRNVIGGDDRKPVPDTSRFPYSATVFIKAYFSNDPPNVYKMCSGTLIGEDAVLTAAHCIHAYAAGGRATTVNVTPGVYIDGKGRQRSLPGVGTSDVKSTLYEGYDDWAGYSRAIIPFDFAVLRLARPLGKLASYLPLAIMPYATNRTISMNAYHGDLCQSASGKCTASSPYTMFASSGPAWLVPGGQLLTHHADMTPGASGAAITGDGALANKVVAINVSESTNGAYNTGVLLNEKNLAKIRKWAGLP